MDNQSHYLDNNLWNDIDGPLTGFHSDFSSGSSGGWNNQVLDFDEIINVLPISQRYPSDLLLAPRNLLEEFNTIFDDLNGEIEKSKSSNTISADDQKKELKQGKKEKKSLMKEKSYDKEEKVLTFEQVSKYFYMPITQAAKELNIGLTLLKKKCRELGIPRWPHRKMKSLQTLIRNVQELGREEGEEEARNAIEILEQEKELMEREPGAKMEEKTKRLRQAYFKANYKKRRMQSQLVPNAAADVVNQNPATNFGDVNDYVYGGVGQSFY